MNFKLLHNPHYWGICVIYRKRILLEKKFFFEKTLFNDICPILQNKPFREYNPLFPYSAIARALTVAQSLIAFARQ